MAGAKPYYRKMDIPNLRSVVVSAVFAAVSLVILVAVLNYVNFDLHSGTGASAVIFTSFGGSAFLLFMMPRAKASSLRRFTASYLIGSVVGATGYWVAQAAGLYAAIGITVFAASVLLVTLDSVHPPAIGLVFAFALYHVDYIGVLVVVMGIMIMMAAKTLLEGIVPMAGHRPMHN